MKRLLVAEQWDQFSRAIMPKDAPSDQRREMRRAFYAGAQAVLFGVIVAMAPEEEVTDSDMAALQGVQDELKDFFDGVTKGVN